MSILNLLQQGGVALYPLAVCSVLVLAVILERIRAYSKIGKLPVELFKQVEKALAAQDCVGALQLLKGSDSSFARVGRLSLEHYLANPDGTADELTMAVEVELAQARRPLPVLATIGNMAPFIGLFGTVLGIMRAFQEVAAKGVSNSAVVTSGIAEALIATAAGLAIGICAVVANNWCIAWVDNYRRELDHFSTRWFNRLANLSRTACTGQDTSEFINESVTLVESEE